MLTLLKDISLRNFYPRPPRGGRRVGAVFVVYYYEISIHALREEGDDMLDGLMNGGIGHFYPRPPRGGRLAERC